MLLSMVKENKMCLRFIKSLRFNMNTYASRVANNPALVVFENFVKTYDESKLYHPQCKIPCVKHFSTNIQSQQHILLKKLEREFKDDEEALRVFIEFKNAHGFPAPSVINKLITRLSYSSHPCSLHKAFVLVLNMAKQRSELLQHDTLFTLCLSLARAQMFVPASKLLRLMLMKNKFPTMDVLSLVFMHMVKTEAGTNLASNILLEFCDCFSAKKPEFAVFVKPSTTVFNLVLDACVRFGSSVKGQQIIEAMAQTGVLADAHSVVLFSYVYEMNGIRDELKKLKDYVDRVSIPVARHYSQFYDKLLNLHFMFNDIDAAANLVRDVYSFRHSRSVHQNKDLSNPCSVPIGSPYLKESLKVQVLFESLQKDSLFNVKGTGEFITIYNGKLVLSCKGLARLIIMYKRSERIGDLSKLIAAVEGYIDISEEGSLCCDVIHSCICSGWLETAHDILDDMEMTNFRLPTSTYMLLLNAYRTERKLKEAEALAKQIKRVGLLLNTTDEIVVSESLIGVTHGSSPYLLAPVTKRQSKLADCMAREMKNDVVDHVKILEINSSIYFFSKAKMMEDARIAYRKLQLLKILPTVQTFAFLIQCYSSLKMYREITILWGDMKRYGNQGCILANRDLYESLLMNFLRGGYFERVMEIINLMKEHNMYADRWMYKEEFFRLHKHLYRKLKATDAKNEAQRLRLEHVTAFRTWVRNN